MEKEIKHKPKVYLSSPIEGLEDLRSEVRSYLEKEKNFEVISYGDICKGYLSGEPGNVDLCLDEVRKSNALFLIVARRYGDLKCPYKVSVTELEYLEAVRHNIKRFVFCREEVWIVNKVWRANEHIHERIKFSWDRRYDHSTNLMNFVSGLKDEDIYINRFRDVKELKERLSDIEFGLDILKDKPEITSVDEKMEVSPYG